MTTMTLEERITRLEDIEAIKQLKFRYSHICDDDHNPAHIASVFADDGIWESEESVAKGHAEIEELFCRFQGVVSFSQHNMMNPIIEVNGDTATGIWYTMGPWDLKEDGKEVWLACRYDDDYVRINGEWKYSHLRVARRIKATM